MRKSWRLVVLLSLSLAACTAAPEPTYKAGMVTDTNGIDDRSFNQTTWQGMERAREQLEVEVLAIEASQQTDYTTNIQQLLDQDFDLIITMGYLTAEDTLAYAAQYPDTDFATVDYNFGEQARENLLGIDFATQEAAFLAGYLSAGMTNTGTIGMFGGIEIPPVTVFMDGFYAGAAYYNEVHGASVQVLGRDLFAGNFESTDDGRRIGEDLISEGADIILPVAGQVGLGTAAAIQDAPGVLMIGVDTDWCISTPEFCPIMLTSILKKMDVAAYDVVKSGLEGSFTGGTYLGTLANGGVDISGYNNFESQVPEALKAEIDGLRQEIIDGNLDITAYYP